MTEQQHSGSGSGGSQSGGRSQPGSPVQLGIAACAKLREMTKGISGVQWQLGDLAIQIGARETQDERTRARTQQHAELRTYADEIGVDYDALMVYRHVASQWAPAQRDHSVPWPIYRELAEFSDRDTRMKDFLASTGQQPSLRALQIFLGRTTSTGSVGNPVAGFTN